MKLYKYFIGAFAIIVIDQIIKLAVHAYMLPGMLGEIQIVGDWFKLHYTLNPGMAFGIKIMGNYGKLILSVFRLIAVTGIGYYIVHLYKNNAHPGFLWCMALVLGGAVGNVVDSTFYGVFLDNSPVDSLTPWFHGQVIDMFYLDIWEGYLPDWLGGGYTALWPIFNFADASIFVGVAIIMIFQNRFFVQEQKQEQTSNAVESEG